MTRIFHTTLLLVTGVLALALWQEKDPASFQRYAGSAARHGRDATGKLIAAATEKVSHAWDHLGAEHARAQSPDDVVDDNVAPRYPVTGYPNTGETAGAPEPAPYTPQADDIPPPGTVWVEDADAPVAGRDDLPPSGGPAYDNDAPLPENYPRAEDYPGATGPAPRRPGPSPDRSSPPYSRPDQQPAPRPGSVAAMPSPTDPSSWPSTKTIATVDGEWILVADVQGMVNAIIMKKLEEIPKEAHESAMVELNKQRGQLMQYMLVGAIETKIIVADARRKIPEENFDKIFNAVLEDFENNELKIAMKRANIATRAEYDAKLRTMGTSLDREKRSFAEATLAQKWVQQHVKVEQEVTHEDMRNHYQEHLADYELPAKVKWEHLQVRFTTGSSKRESYRAIAELGNKVLDGATFQQLIDQGNGGRAILGDDKIDWTARESLASDVLRDALFALPVGQLSPILEDGQTFNIVRVVERTEAGRVSFRDAQVKIKDSIRKERLKEKREEYVAKLKEQAQVWTIFGDLAELLGTDPPETARKNSRNRYE